MRRRTRYRFFLLTCLAVFSLSASAQEVVHALTGTVVSIDSKAKTILVKPDDGTEGLFKLPTKQDGSLDFDKNVRAGTTPAAAFTKTNTQVLIYYIGYNTERTVVAVQDLGSARLVKVVGPVISFNKHQHLLTVKNASGAEVSFQVDDKTVAETPGGVTEMGKFDPHKGDRLRVVALSSSGAAKALFIRVQ